jgi:hypothetical protein
MDAMEGLTILQAAVKTKEYRPQEGSLLRYAFLLGMTGIPRAPHLLALISHQDSRQLSRWIGRLFTEAKGD